MTQLASIQLERFKSFQNTTFCFKSHNILVGANNSGKSSILHAIRLFFKLAQNAFVGTAGNIKFRNFFVDITEKIPLADSSEIWYQHKKSNRVDRGMKITASFANGLRLQIILTDMFSQTHVAGVCLDNPTNLTGDGINGILNMNVAFISGMQGILTKESYVTPARINTLVSESRYIEIFRSSLLNLKNENYDNIDALNSILEEYLDIKISNISFDPNKDEFLSVEYEKDKINYDISNAGSGMQQIIQMLTHLYLNNPRIILVDEPDAHLHPDLQCKIGAILRDFAQHNDAQLFIATHSPEIIDVYDNKEVFLIDNSRPRITAIGQDNDFINILFKKGILTSSSLTNLAVKPNCFVYEDENDKYIKKIAQLLGCDIFKKPGRTKSAKGVNNFEYIFDIYKSVSSIINRDLSLFFLQDRDGVPANYVKLIEEYYQNNSIKEVHILQRHEIENYLIEPQLLFRVFNSTFHLDLTMETVENIMREAAGRIVSLQRDARTRCVTIVHRCKPGSKKDKDIEDEIDQTFRKIDFSNIKTIQHIIPGKEFFSKLHDIIDEKYHVNFSIHNCLDLLEAADIDEELKQFFEKLKR